jgi:hypothetical protein
MGYEEENLPFEDDRSLTDGILVVVHVRRVNSTIEAEREFRRWYEEDHLPPLR